MIKIFSKLLFAMFCLCIWAPIAHAQQTRPAIDRDGLSIEEDSLLRELGIIDDPFWGLTDFENEFLNDLFGMPSKKGKKRTTQQKRDLDAPFFVPRKRPKKEAKPSNKDMDDFIESMMDELTKPKSLPFDDPKLTLARLAISWR